MLETFSGYEQDPPLEIPMPLVVLVAQALSRGEVSRADQGCVGFGFTDAEPDSEALEILMYELKIRDGRIITRALDYIKQIIRDAGGLDEFLHEASRLRLEREAARHKEQVESRAAIQPPSLPSEPGRSIGRFLRRRK